MRMSIHGFVQLCFICCISASFSPNFDSILNNSNAITFKKDTVNINTNNFGNSIAIVINNRLCTPCIDHLYTAILENIPNKEIYHYQVWNSQIDTFSNLMSLHACLFDVKNKFLITNDISPTVNFNYLKSMPTPLVIFKSGQEFKTITYEELFDHGQRVRKERLGDLY